MIRRLRIKFICINMTIVTVMLCTIFGLVLHFTGNQLERESIEMMQSVALDPHRPGVPGQLSRGVRLPYFSLQLGPEGEMLVWGGGYYDLSDRELLDDLIRRASLQKTGELTDYGLRYVRVVTPNQHCIVFADMSSEISTINSLLRSCLLIGTVSFFLFLLISIFLARWAVKPVESAWEQQRQFVADASHELKTPLSVILSNAQLLADTGEDPRMRARTTASIIAVSRQMKDLVNKLLSCAQLDQEMDAMELSPLDLSQAVTDTLLRFEPIFYEGDLTLNSDISPDIWVRGSRSHLLQVVDILLDNAQKYSTKQGETTLSLRPDGKKHCLLTVVNQGPSLSPQDMKHLFERFYRADPARERNGSYGLGLPIAQGIVQAHRGRIWVESKDGFNYFFVQLPLTTPSA